MEDKDRKLAAGEAADLIKRTAEATETAFNIKRIQEDIKEIKQTLKDVNMGFVTIRDFNEHLKDDDKHEVRMQELEANTSDIKIIKKLVYGCVAIILSSVIFAIVYLVIQK